jgi:hypothetical protein
MIMCLKKNNNNKNALPLTSGLAQCRLAAGATQAATAPSRPHVVGNAGQQHILEENGCGQFESGY